ncbi:MAG: hypothetical protein ACI9CF_001193 [Candidatus Omnitrophota bacterium]|jgi:hypothetical protein
METLSQNAAILLIGWASGINLYLTVALTGICGRMGWLTLPDSMDIVQSPVIIGIAILLYAVEFCADKIPVVDSAWDSLHTIIRPAGALVMGFLAGSEYGPIAQTVIGLSTGAIALETHTFKATSRAAINLSPEPVTNIAASVTEDVAVVSAFWFFMQHPIITSIVLILTLIGAFFVIISLWKFVAGLFGGKKISPDQSRELRDQVPEGQVQ